MKKNYKYIMVIAILVCIIVVLKINSNLNVKNSVVYIEAASEETVTNGSGFVYKIENGLNYIITNYHVIEGYQDIYVYNNKKKKLKANLLNSDEYYDIAILTIEDKLNLNKIDIYNKYNIKEKVYTIGTPLDIKNINKVSKGYILNNEVIKISTTHGTSNLESIRVNMNVDYGNSGGPLLNKKNKVIGVVYVKDKGKNDVVYALPIENVMDMVIKLEDQNYSRPNLGAVMCNNTNIEMLMKYNVVPSNIDGVVLLDVKEKLLLDSVGMKNGDIIVMLNDKRIKSVNKLRQELFKNEIGDIVEIKYYRGNVYKSVKIKL